MKSLILLAFTALALSGFSQEPFGKRFSVSAKQGFTMANYISTEFIGHNRLSVNCVFGKNFMIGIDGNYAYARYKDYVTNPDQVLKSNWENAPQIRDLSVGVSLYYFRDKEGGYAPSGRYFFVSASHGVANQPRTEEVITQVGWNEYTAYYNYLDKETTRKSTILGIGFGRNFIVNKRILLGYSLDFSLDLRAITSRWAVRYIMRPSIQIGYTF